MMFKLILVAFAQVLLIQSIAGQFVGSRLAAAPLAFAEDVYEGYLSAAAALPYLGTEVVREALPNNDAGDIPGFAGPFRYGGTGPYRYDDDGPYGFDDDGPYRYGNGPFYPSGLFGPFRPSNYDASYSEAYSFAASVDVD